MRFGPAPHKLACLRSMASPQGYRRCKQAVGETGTGQLLAFTHSASLGKRLPSQRAQAAASCQLTPTTG